MAYALNTWYVAAWDDEVRPRRLLHRRLAEQAVVMFRDSAGVVQALADRCPHRFVPLHLGTLQGDAIQCGYHGLRFNGHGECVHNPHGAIPRAARVRAYPVVERHSFIWIWLGDAARADPAQIPDFGFQDADKWCTGKGYLHIRTNYLLEVDNIMDLSHTEFVHAGSLGSSGISQADYRAFEDGPAVWSNRRTHGEIMTDDLCDAMGVPRREPADRWINVRWHAPANMALYAGAVPAGAPDSTGRETPGAHCFSPETASTTHYWYSICFPRSMGEAAERMARENLAYIQGPFETEDRPMLEAQQDCIGDADLMELKPVLLSGDAGGVRARRVLAKMIAAEANAGSA